MLKNIPAVLIACAALESRLIKYSLGCTSDICGDSNAKLSSEYIPKVDNLFKPFALLQIISYLTQLKAGLV